MNHSLHLPRFLGPRVTQHVGPSLVAERPLVGTALPRGRDDKHRQLIHHNIKNLWFCHDIVIGQWLPQLHDRN